MPSMVLPTLPGSTSNAAVIFSLSPLPLKYLVMACPRCPMPSTAIFICEGLSRIRLMYSMSTCTSYPFFVSLEKPISIRSRRTCTAVMPWMPASTCEKICVIPCLWLASSVRRYSLRRSMVFSGIAFVKDAIVLLFDGYREVAVVVASHPAAVDVVVALLALSEEIGGLKGRVTPAFHVVLDVVVHRGAEDHRRIVAAV